MNGNAKRTHRSARAVGPASKLRGSVKGECARVLNYSLFPSNAFWSLYRHFALARSILSMATAIIMMITEATRANMPVECSISGYCALGSARPTFPKFLRLCPQIGCLSEPNGYEGCTNGQCGEKPETSTSEDLHRVT